MQSSGAFRIEARWSWSQIDICNCSYCKDTVCSSCLDNALKTRSCSSDSKISGWFLLGINVKAHGWKLFFKWTFMRMHFKQEITILFESAVFHLCSLHQWPSRTQLKRQAFSLSHVHAVVSSHTQQFICIAPTGQGERHPSEITLPYLAFPTCSYYVCQPSQNINDS